MLIGLSEINLLYNVYYVSLQNYFWAQNIDIVKPRNMYYLILDFI